MRSMDSQRHADALSGVLLGVPNELRNIVVDYLATLCIQTKPHPSDPMSRYLSWVGDYTIGYCDGRGTYVWLKPGQNDGTLFFHGDGVLIDRGSGDGNRVMEELWSRRYRTDPRSTGDRDPRGDDVTLLGCDPLDMVTNILYHHPRGEDAALRASSPLKMVTNLQKHLPFGFFCSHFDSQYDTDVSAWLCRHHNLFVDDTCNRRMRHSCKNHLAYVNPKTCSVMLIHHNAVNPTMQELEQVQAVGEAHNVRFEWV